MTPDWMDVIESRVNEHYTIKMSRSETWPAATKSQWFKMPWKRHENALHKDLCELRSIIMNCSCRRYLGSVKGNFRNSLQDISTDRGEEEGEGGDSIWVNSRKLSYFVVSGFNQEFQLSFKQSFPVQLKIYATVKASRSVNYKFKKYIL